MIGKKAHKKIRKDVLKILKTWNGKIIEPKYTSRISSTLIKKKIKKRWN